MASSPGSSPATPSPPTSSPSPPAPSTSPPPPASSPPPLDSSTPPPSPPVSQTPPAPPPSTPQTPPPGSSPPPPVTPPPSSSPPPPSPPQANSPPPSTSLPSPPPSRNSPPPSRNSPPPAASSPPPTTQPTPPSPGVNQVPPPANSPPSSNRSPPPPSSSSPPKSSPAAPTPSGSTLSPPAPPTSTPTPPSNSSSTNSSALPSSPSQTPTSKAATPSATDTLAPPTNNSSSSSGVQFGVAFGVVALVLVVGFVAAFLFIRRQKRRKEMYNPYILPSPFASSQGSGSSFLRHQSVSNIQGPNSSGDFAPSSSDVSALGNSRTWFSYEELSDATDGFATKNILGAGGFGCVYKGHLADGHEVAVKKLKSGSGQGDREFKAEVEIISRVHHRYLVSLVGYCINDYERLLVYEFVANNTLDYHLHAANKPVMEWALRVKVAAGAARGIAYLHEDCHPRIIHRDIKSANILLDNNFEAKVADFGLAKLAEELDANTHVSTRVMGTFGYMAPEYASSGKLTEKSDVYSFGVVLLEIITGRKPVDATQPLGDESLVEWARPLLTQALDNEYFDEVADPRLEGNYIRSEMFRMIEAAAACVRHSASKRPKMSQVVRALDTAAELSSDLSNGMKPGQSEIYNSREQSAQIRNFQRMAFGSQDNSSEFFNYSQSSWTSGRTGL